MIEKLRTQVEQSEMKMKYFNETLNSLKTLKEESILECISPKDVKKQEEDVKEDKKEEDKKDEETKDEEQKDEEKKTEEQTNGDAEQHQPSEQEQQQPDQSKAEGDLEQHGVESFSKEAVVKLFQQLWTNKIDEILKLNEQYVEKLPKVEITQEQLNNIDKSKPMDAEIFDQISRLEQQLAETKKEHEKQTAETIQQWEKQLADCRNYYEKQIEEVKQHWEKQLSEAKQQHASHVEHLDQQLNMWKEKNKMKNKAAHALQQELTQTKQIVTNLTNEKQQLEDTIRERESEIAKMREELKNGRHDLDSVMQKLLYVYVIDNV